MEGWSKGNVITIVSLLISGSVGYGVLSSRVDTIDKVQRDNIAYVPQFIQVKTELKYMKEESVRTRKVWEKLDGTLDSLNDTLIKQGSEIQALKETVNDIKKVVIKEASQN